MANYNDTLIDWLLNTPASDLAQWFQLSPQDYSPEELSVLKDRLVERWVMATGQEPRPIDEAGKFIIPLPQDPGIHQGTQWDNINDPLTNISDIHQLNEENDQRAYDRYLTFERMARTRSLTPREESIAEDSLVASGFTREEAEQQVRGLRQGKEI